MVASRKKPSAPAPPASRTHSTQALPRAVGAHASHSNFPAASDKHTNSPLAPSEAEPNGVAKTNSRKSNSNPPRTQRKKRSPLDRLFILFLSTFVAYVLYNCPSDSTFSNPVCRSLASYRTHVLEPYVVPPLRAAATHPSIVEPYQKYAKPIYQNYIEPVTPYVAAASRRTAPYIDKAVSASARATQRVWNDVIKVYWMRGVVPQYRYHAQPYVEKYVSPITKRVNPYVQELALQTSSFAYGAKRRAQIAYDQVQPYVATTYAFAKPRVIRGYVLAKPHLLRAAGIAQSQGRYLASGTMVVVRSGLQRIGDLRREFVDPHVLRIWEKAVEKSGHSASPSLTATQSESAFTEESIVTDPLVVSEALEETPAVNTVTPTLIDTLETAASVAEQSVAHASKVIDELEREIHITEAAPVVVTTVDRATPTSIDTLEKAASVAEQSAAHASKVIGELEREIHMAEAAQLDATPTPQAGITSEPTPSRYPEAEHDLPSEKPAVDQPQAAEDLDDFLKDIGFDDDEEKAPEPEPEHIPEATPEVDKEAKKAATALKRANIVGRHARWQSQLDELAGDMEIRVKNELLAIRKDAVAILGQVPPKKDSSSSDGKGQEAIEKVQNEGEKLLKGLEAYVKKLMAREIKPEDQEKEQESYDRVIDKVEAKFKDVVSSVQEEVHSWYMSVRDKEVGAIIIAGRELKALADQAQADLGIDYAWLDDVTYQDWQKYHDLMRAYERFDQLVRSLQNGTHPEALEDKLVPVLNNLDYEIQTMIDGFAMRMSVIVRDGERWLAGLQPIAVSEEKDETDPKEAVEPVEPKVSILPISPGNPERELRPEDVILGKSSEQVEKMGQQAQHVLERTEL